MCYSWHEDVEKSVHNDVAQEEPRKTVLDGYPEDRARPEHSRFWAFRIGRRDSTTEEATADRNLERV
jgi:hypothetical protein